MYKFKKIKRFIRLQKPISRLRRPLYPFNFNKITIETTAICNLKCTSCHASCDHAPSEDFISIEQIRKFIDESMRTQKKWAYIQVTGGEATLHPNIHSIIEELLKHKNNFSPYTTIRLNTNGLGQKIQKVLSTMPSNIIIANSKKKNSSKKNHVCFHVAPIDYSMLRFIDFSQGCHYIQGCAGLGLSKYGYYGCPVAAGIDRVFGFNLGFKELLGDKDEKKARNQLNSLCAYCGHFLAYNFYSWKRSDMTDSWKKAFEIFPRNKTKLTDY